MKIKGKHSQLGEELKYLRRRVVELEQVEKERGRAEEMLRESEERYRMLFEGSAEGILVADLETKEFTYVNPAICRMLGYTEEELKRMSVVDIHPKEALQHVISEFEAQARGEKKLAPAIPCLRKDGMTIYADVSTTKVLIDGREYNVGFFTDITERKQAEEKSIKKQEELERFNALAVDRELKMIELKREINALLEKLGKDPRYKIPEQSMAEVTQ